MCVTATQGCILYYCMRMHTVPFYDPNKSYEDNFTGGPFGAFADREIFKSQGNPSYQFLHQNVHFPFGIASGPLLNGKYVKAALDKGFDLATYKTVRTTAYASHPWPNILFVHASDKIAPQDEVVATSYAQSPSSRMTVTNSFGVPSYNPDYWQPDMKDAVVYAQNGQVVIGSFQGTITGTGSIQAYIEDFKLAARLVQETGVKVMEVNLSCPNEGSDRLLCFDIDRTHAIVDAIKQTIGNTPLIAKIAYFDDETLLHAFIRTIGPLVQGIEAINTIPTKVVTTSGKQALPGKNREKSGVGGSSIKWAGLEMTERLKALREKIHGDFAIIGVGGVSTAQDYEEYIHAGADAVMAATAPMWNPYLAQEIKRLSRG